MAAFEKVIKAFITHDISFSINFMCVPYDVATFCNPSFLKMGVIPLTKLQSRTDFMHILRFYIKIQSIRFFFRSALLIWFTSGCHIFIVGNLGILCCLLKRTMHECNPAVVIIMLV